MQKAISTCRAGGVIAYPTEAVFGLGCIPIYEHSVRRIIRLKRRSIRKGLILVASETEQLEEFFDAFMAEEFPDGLVTILTINSITDTELITTDEDGKRDTLTRKT